MTLPTISTKQKYAIAGVAIVVAFAAGRFSVQQPEIKTEVSEKTAAQKDQTKDTHTQTTITTVKTPDGTVKTVEQINQVADVKTAETSVTNTNIKTDVIPPKLNTLNVSALISNNFANGVLQPSYGISVTKQVLGPVTVGAFGLTSGVVGVSIGLNF
jgi:hypothetical protein